VRDFDARAAGLARVGVDRATAAAGGDHDLVRSADVEQRRVQPLAFAQPGFQAQLTWVLRADLRARLGPLPSAV
jgi:hypothetical protein